MAENYCARRYAYDPHECLGYHQNIGDNCRLLSPNQASHESFVIDSKERAVFPQRGNACSEVYARLRTSEVKPTVKAPISSLRPPLEE